MNHFTYRILLNQGPEEEYTVIVPALPGCITYGDDLNHAMEMAKEAIEGYIDLFKEQGEPNSDDSRTLEYSLTIAS